MIQCYPPESDLKLAFFRVATPWESRATPKAGHSCKTCRPGPQTCVPCIKRASWKWRGGPASVTPWSAPRRATVPEQPYPRSDAMCGMPSSPRTLSKSFRKATGKSSRKHPRVLPSRQAVFTKHMAVPGPQTRRWEPCTLGWWERRVEHRRQERPGARAGEGVLWGQTARARAAPPPPTEPATWSGSPTLAEPQLPPLDNAIIWRQNQLHGGTEWVRSRGPLACLVAVVPVMRVAALRTV